MDNHAEKCPCCQAGVHLFECPVFHKLCYITCEIIQRFQSSCLYEYIRKLMAFQCTEHEQLHEGRVFLMCLEEKEGYRHKSLSPILALQPFYQERLPFPVIALHINYCRIKMFLSAISLVVVPLKPRMEKSLIATFTICVLLSSAVSRFLFIVSGTRLFCCGKPTSVREHDSY